MFLQCLRDILFINEILVHMNCQALVQIGEKLPIRASPNLILLMNNFEGW